MKKFKKKIYKYFKILSFLSIVLIILSIIAIVYADNTIEKSAKGLLYSDSDSIKSNKVGLLLGTSKYIARNRTNFFYKYRIDAAIELFKKGKIKAVLVSGDNRKKTYNEPNNIKNDLIAGGIPDSVIYLDYAGFRTYDSMIRAYKVFGQSKFTVISQKFHNERAIYIAKKLGLDVVGFNAKDVVQYSTFKTKVREKFARVKVFWDLFTSAKPKFLGEPVHIK